MALTFREVPPVVPELWKEPPIEPSFWLADCSTFLAKNPDKHHQIALSMVMLNWQIALHWLYKKKCASKHKIPGSRKLARSIEPFGEVLMALLELTIQVHSHGSEVTRRYPNAGIWFQYVALEAYPLCFNRASKELLVEDLRAVVRRLRDCRNPFDAKRYPHLSALVTASLEIAMQPDMDRFNREYWVGLQNVKPNSGRSFGLISSLTKWISAIRDPANNMAVVHVSESNAIANTGSGKGMKQVWKA